MLPPPSPSPLNRTFSLPAALHSTLDAKPHPHSHYERGGGDGSGSLERWKKGGDGSPGEKQQERWTSGFPNSTKIRDVEHLNAQDFFRWISDVTQLSEEDIASLAPCRDLPHGRMAEQVFSRFMEFKAFRSHLHIDGERQLAARKDMMRKYLTWCLTLRTGGADSYPCYLERVSSVHHMRGRNVPYLHMLVGLAVTQDTVLNFLCKQISDKDQLRKTTCAVSKLMWIQAAFFARHTALAHSARPFWKKLAFIWAVLTASRCATIALGAGAAQILRKRSAGFLAAFIDIALAAAGAVVAGRLGW